MKVTLNAIRQLNERYGSAEDVTKAGVDKLVEKIGAQLGAVEEVKKLGPKYRGIVIAKVVTCEKHPNADKLSVCTIDDGGRTPDVKRGADGLVQVVCGAPNVRAGLTVAWLPPGSTVPETFDKEPFVLEAREIRGQKSNGMLASPKELGLSDSHKGILEIDGDHQPGSDFAAEFKLADEVVIDIENKMFTHRPDLFGWLGIGRELTGIHKLPFKSPDWYVADPEMPEFSGQDLPLKIVNEVPELAPRFTALAMRDIQIKPSPVWMQVALAKVGQKPINNIVDLTNFYMLLTGQPLHAYDYDKVKALSTGDTATIVVRQPRDNEKITLLNGKTIDPRQDAVMIATDQQLIGIGGVMGGADTEVDDNTQNIIIEVANFDMYSVRRTSMAHGLFTEAVTRFTKGQSPLQTPAVLLAMAKDVERLAGGRLAGPVIDDNHLPRAALSRQSVHPPVKVGAEFINARLGLRLTAEEMQKLLENVEFKVMANGDELTVAAPFWRTDIELREDIVEEIGRLYGYDQLPLELPRRRIEPTPKDPLLEAKATIRSRLSAAGANEVLTYSFVHGDLLRKAGQDPEQAFQVANALSPDLQYYRISLLPSLLEKVRPNVKAGYDEFALFELGKTHGLQQDKNEEGLPREFDFTALVYAANDKLKRPGAPYYQVRKYLEALAGVELEFKPVGKEMRNYQVVQPYNLNRSALVGVKGGDFLGIIGEFKPSVTRSLKLPRYSAGFEVDISVLAEVLSRPKQYVPLPRFPKVTQDITLSVATDLPYQDLLDFLKQRLAEIQPPEVLSGLEPVDIFQRPDDNRHKHLTYRLSIASYERTLTDTEINKLLDSLAGLAHDKFGAERL